MSSTPRYRLDTRALGRVYRRFSPHLRPFRRTLLGAGACMVGVTAMEIARPWPLKIIFDGLLMPQPEPDAVTGAVLSASGGGDMLLAVTAGAILVLAVLSGLFGFGQSYLLATVGQKVVARIREQLYSHIQRLSHSFHEASRTGDLLARLTEDVRMMRDLMVNAVIYTGARTLVIAGTLVVMMLMDWRLTLVAVSILPLLVLATHRFGNEIKGAARKKRRKESRIAEVMTESISSIKLVQAYAREAYEEGRFARQNSSSAKAGLVATRLEAHLDRVVQVILAVGTCAVLWYGVKRVQAGALSPGDLLVFSAYLVTLYKPVRKLAALTGRISKATVCGERILSILDLEPDIADHPDARTAPRFEGAIEFDHVSFGYGRGANVLEDVSFRVAPGETVALVGASGAGKSTIGSLLLRFYDPVEGAVRIDGGDLRDYRLASLREQIAIVLQETALFATTIRDNIAYGRLDATDEEIVAAAKAACAHEFIERLPEGYDTVVGERGSTLSGGQRQRIAIARAIVRDAPVVVLDEPTTGLDAVSERAVREALGRLMRGRTCILVTHDMEALSLADRVLVLRDGELAERDAAELAPRALAAGEVG